MTTTSFATKWAVTGTWAQHRARGSLGGVDYGAPLGSPILAPEDGVVDYRVAGTGGYTVRITYSNGASTEIMHMRTLQYLPNGTRVAEGRQIGISGGAKGSAGAGSSDGPHMHVHDNTPGGTRVAPFTQVPNSTATGQTGVWGFSNGLTPEVQGLLQRWMKKEGRLPENYEVDNVLGEKAWVALQNELDELNLYDGPVDGIPEKKSYAALMTWAKTEDNRIDADGRPGDLTNAALKKKLERILAPAAPPAPEVQNSELQPDEIKLVAAYLNKMNLGRSTTSDQDGKAQDGDNYVFMVQIGGKKLDVYPDDYKEDGEYGPATRSAERAILAKAKEAAAPKPPVAETPPASKVIPRPSIGSVGNDLARTQFEKGFNFDLAKEQGMEYGIIKTAGFNVKPQYKTDYLEEMIDELIRLGLPKGYYYVPGMGQSPEQQAEFFVKQLYKFDVEHDVLMLDNEVLDANGIFWLQADVVRFVKKVIELTRIHPARVWVYAGASPEHGGWRNRGPWEKVVDTGVRTVWAAYGSYPDSYVPDHTPDLQGALPWWDIHQHTSKMTVGGVNPVDGLYSRFSVKELFNGDGKTPASKVVVEPKPETPTVPEIPSVVVPAKDVVVLLNSEAEFLVSQVVALEARIAQLRAKAKELGETT